jgi:hypothetical protein
MTLTRHITNVQCAMCNCDQVFLSSMLEAGLPVIEGSNTAEQWRLLMTALRAIVYAQ